MKSFDIPNVVLAKVVLVAMWVLAYCTHPPLGIFIVLLGAFMWAVMTLVKHYLYPSLRSDDE